MEWRNEGSSGGERESGERGWLRVFLRWSMFVVGNGLGERGN